jgi:hypothetical protein
LGISPSVKSFSSFSQQLKRLIPMPTGKRGNDPNHGYRSEQVIHDCRSEAHVNALPHLLTCTTIAAPPFSSSPVPEFAQ